MKLFVLIVDDEFGLAEMSADLLVEDGFEVDIAINGRLGLDVLESRAVDLVLTDLMMPVMDGLELIRRIRSDPALSAVPVILMTALPEAVPAGGASQYDAVLVKPFSVAELMEAVRRLTKRT